MTSLFGLFILVIVIVALARRRREKRAYAREEILDESGVWIDKRAGERGTFGSLDAERERQGQERSRQGRVTELAQLVRAFAFEEIPGFHTRSDDEIRAANQRMRPLAASFVAAVETFADSGLAATVAGESAETDPGLTAALKKRLLDFAYTHFPALLNLDIDALRRFDGLAEEWARRFVQAC